MKQRQVVKWERVLESVEETLNTPHEVKDSRKLAVDKSFEHVRVWDTQQILEGIWVFFIFNPGRN
jgi:hypothetical protein